MNYDKLYKKLSIVKNTHIDIVRNDVIFTGNAGNEIYVKNYLGNHIRYKTYTSLLRTKYDPLTMSCEKDILNASINATQIRENSILNVLKWNNDGFTIMLDNTIIENFKIGDWFSKLKRGEHVYESDNNGVVLELNNNVGSSVRKYRCLKHPKYTWQKYSKTGCPMCGGRVIDRDSFIAKSKTAHNGKYIEFGEYKSQRHKIMIKCPIHGWFSQLPHNHLSGHGCKLCGNNH